jgi:hypothetical protein
MNRSNKQPSFTKSGPGRRVPTNTERKERAESRTLKQKSAGAFGRGLMNNITRKQLALLEQRGL